MFSVFRKFDSHMKELVSGASVAFVLKVAGAALAFGFNVTLSRMLGAEGAGLYFLALALSTVTSVLARVGLDNSLLRFVATGAAREEWASVKGICRKAVIHCLLASTAASVLLFLLAPYLAEKVFSNPALTGIIRLMAASVLPFALLNLFAEMLKGLKRVSLSVMIQGIGVVGFSLALLYPLVKVWGVRGAALSYLIATALTAALAIFLWKASTPMLRGLQGRFDTLTLFKSSLPLFGVALLGLVMQWSSIFALGIWGSKADVGIFGAAQRMAMLISFILVAINSVAAPRFAELHSSGNINALASTAWRAARLSAFLALPALVAFTFFSEEVMGLFGPDFTKGGVELAILSIGQFINVVIGPVGALLMMTGNESRTGRDVLFGGVANISLNLALVPVWGPTGAALATSGSLVVMNLFLVNSVSKILGIRMLRIC